MKYLYSLEVILCNKALLLGDKVTHKLSKGNNYKNKLGNKTRTVMLSFSKCLSSLPLLFETVSFSHCCPR